MTQKCIYHVLLMLLALLVACAGINCKEKGRRDRTHVGGNPPSAEVMAYAKSLARGMQTVSVSRLSDKHVGKACVIVARTASGHVAPPPPPPGMMRIMGSMTVYNAALAAHSEEGVTVEAPYPTSGKSKSIDIPREDVQSIAIKE